MHQRRCPSRAVLSGSCAIVANMRKLSREGARTVSVAKGSKRVRSHNFTRALLLPGNFVSRSLQSEGYQELKP
jgi:hypothetical protein